jgi:hypothetical protein
MPAIIFDDGFIRMSVRYVKAFKGVLYYYRRVPKDLLRHYRGPHLKQSLRTKDLNVAAKKAQSLATQHDAYWKTLRAPEGKELQLTTRESRDAAMALLGDLGIEPGSARQEVSPRQMSSREILLEHFERQHGDRFLEAREEGDDWTIENEVLNAAELEAWRLVNENPRR